MLNRTTLGLATALLITTPLVAAQSLEEKRAKETPLLECIISIKLLVGATLQSDKSLGVETDDDYYGNLLDLIAKYSVAAVAIVYKNSDEQFTSEQSVNYINARNLELTPRIANAEMEEYYNIVDNCIDHEQEITEEGNMLTEEMYGYGSALTYRNMLRKEIGKSFDDGVFLKQ
jgi:hypothetical protein